MLSQSFSTNGSSSDSHFLYFLHCATNWIMYEHWL